MTGSIIVLLMSMLLTPCRLLVFLQQFGAWPVPLLSRSPGKAGLTNASFLLPKQNRLSLKCGFFVSGLPAFANWICCPVASLVYLLTSNTIRSTTSTIRNTRRSRNVLHSLRQSVPRTVNAVSIWILDSCEPLPRIMLALISLRIGSSVLMMGTRRIFLSLLRHPGWLGFSSQSLRTLPLILFVLSYLCMAIRMAGPSHGSRRGIGIQWRIPGSPHAGVQILAGAYWCR